ncbi:MAG: hypothetical protein HQK53_02745 [Oligoflexia bacterium]|nr:hypothetical protein [Oligoflexia bacterium]
MESKDKKILSMPTIDQDFNIELLADFYKFAVASLDKFEVNIFEYTDSKNILYIDQLQMDIHSLIGAALSVELKKVADYLYRFDDIIKLNVREKEIDKYIDFYYFVVDKFRAYFYQLEHKENIELSEKLINSTLERKGESERSYILRCINDLEEQLAILKKALAEIEAGSNNPTKPTASAVSPPSK